MVRTCPVLVTAPVCAPQERLKRDTASPTVSPEIGTKAWPVSQRGSRLPLPHPPAVDHSEKQDLASRAQQMFSECRVKFCLFQKKIKLYRLFK